MHILIKFNGNNTEYNKPPPPPAHTHTHTHTHTKKIKGLIACLCWWEQAVEPTLTVKQMHTLDSVWLSGCVDV